LSRLLCAALPGMLAEPGAINVTAVLRRGLPGQRRVSLRSTAAA
jgi:hypothetical protein